MNASKVLIPTLAMAALSLSTKGEQKESALPQNETQDFSIKTMDVTGSAIAGAEISVWNRADRVVIGPDGQIRSRAEPISRVTSDNSGIARIQYSPGTRMLVWHRKYRPAIWLLGARPKELKEINIHLLPIIRGTIRVAPHQKSANISVASQFIPNIEGDLHAEPERMVHPITSGEFVLNTEIAVRSPASRVIVGAMDIVNNVGAFVSLSHAESQQPVNMALQPLRRLRCVFQLPTGEKFVHVGLCDNYGATIASYAVMADQTTPDIAILNLRLPPGSYELRFGKTSSTEELHIPIELKPGDDDFDLGIIRASNSKLSNLVGNHAPEIEVRGPEGGRKLLADLRGKIVVLYFWGYWCGPCVAGMPALMKTADQFAGRDIEFVLIHDPSLADLAELQGTVQSLEDNSWAGQKLSLLTVLDSAAPDNPRAGVTAERYGIRLWPTIVVIDKAAKIVGLANKETLPDILGRLTR